VSERASADDLERALQVILEAVEEDRVDVERARQLVRTCGLLEAARVVEPVQSPLGSPDLRVARESELIR
jgi:hypothetical protein